MVDRLAVDPATKRVAVPEASPEAAMTLESFSARSRRLERPRVLAETGAPAA
ncbi:MAG: hypothetical protein HY901_24985 [Deltaproteobacteria bacterium]|nr:hypothetical protein [Deltaproteobacteria bacterium]